MQKKTSKKILLSRYLKVLSTKISEFKDAVVLLHAHKSTDKDLDISDLRELAKKLDNLEKSGSYFIIGQDVGVDIYDRKEIKNKDIIITVSHNGSINTDRVEEDFKKAFKDANSITVLYAELDNLSVEIK